MGLFTAWGFSTASWQGRRGEYWVLLQVVLILGFVILPTYRPDGFVLPEPPLTDVIWVVATLLGAIAALLLGKGLIDLGHNLTPLPHPRDDGQLVQTGIYGVVRHPLYSGLILAAAGWTIFLLSLSHLVGTVFLFLFLNAKANREEIWLIEKYPDYEDYRRRVKKIIPWIY